MPRLARTVFADVAHHITQRGNRREDIFFTDEDRETYRGWLKDYGQRYDVAILAYCLMSNHIHLVGVPATEEGLQATLKPLHMRYTQRLNRQRGWKGHVWQGRYFSSPLDEAYLWASIRYVERNPVRARMVKKAENYRWSSAQTHCGLRRVMSLRNWQSFDAMSKRGCLVVPRDSSRSLRSWPVATCAIDHEVDRLNKG